MKNKRQYSAKVFCTTYFSFPLITCEVKTARLISYDRKTATIKLAEPHVQELSHCGISLFLLTTLSSMTGKTCILSVLTFNNCSSFFIL